MANRSYHKLVVYPIRICAVGTPDLVSQRMQYYATLTKLLISRSMLQLSHLSEIAAQNNQVAAPPLMSKLVCGLVVPHSACN